MREEEGNTIKDSEKSVKMTTQASVTVTKNGPAQKGPREVLSVHADRQPTPVEVVRCSPTLAQEEERIEEHRRSTLRVIPPISCINQPRSILANRPVSMDDSRSKGARPLSIWKIESSNQRSLRTSTIAGSPIGTVHKSTRAISGLTRHNGAPGPINSCRASA